MSAPETSLLEIRLHHLIEERLGIVVPAPDTDLVASGLLDSLALVTLIVAVEDSFACRLPLQDFDLDHFRSICTLAVLVGSHISAG